MHADVICLHSTGDSCRRSGNCAGSELWGGSRQHSVFVFRHRVTQHQSSDGRAVTLLSGSAQFTDPAKVGAGAHDTAADLHGVQLKIARVQQLSDSATVEVITRSLP